MNVSSEEPNVLCRMIAVLGGWPWVLAWATTLFAVGLAVASRGPYDPHLAVLTATLVAVIWYAYFTFRGVRRPARVTLRIRPWLGLDTPMQDPCLRPGVENMTERPIHARYILRVWIDGKPVRLGPFYQGEKTVLIPGRREPRGYVPLQGYLIWKHERLASQTCLVAFRAEWIDSLCERGHHPTMYWHIDLQDRVTSNVVDPDRIEDLFGELPDPYDESVTA